MFLGTLPGAVPLEDLKAFAPDRADGESVTVGPRTFIRVPKGTPHEIVNASGQRLVKVHIYSPKLESADVVPLA